MSAHQVIVGLDDSPTSHKAHEWAARYAQVTASTLRAVHVLQWPIGLRVSSVAKSGTRLRVPKQEVALAYLRGMKRVFNDVDNPDGAVLQFAQGDVGDVLVRVSTEADLLVIGTRQPIRGQRYLAGSVSDHCVTFATCPVVTVPTSAWAEGKTFDEDKTPEAAVRTEAR